ncbi:hypothetical protein EKN07_12265 [Actinobaculum sp. 352]|nr:hypothetical protein EKN07_12265 [Actinobaculum sp. 352]
MRYSRKTFWTGAAERAVKTFAQSMLAVLTAGTVIWGLDWAGALGVGATAAVLSLLTSIADPDRVDPVPAGGEDDDPDLEAIRDASTD